MKNAQLWKRILNEGVRMLSKGEEWASFDMQKLIVTSTIITDATPRSTRDPLFDFENLAVLPLPFNMIWMEWNLDDSDTLAGAFIWCSDDSHKENGEILSPPTRLVQVFGCMALSGRKPTITPPIEIKIGRACEVVSLGIDIEKVKTSRLTTKAQIVECGEEGLKLGFLCPELIGFAVETLMLLGCKNVSVAPRDNDPKQVARAVKRHGGNPDKYRYHVLVVRPPGAKSDAPAQEIGVMPRHVCRGHFSEYGPLFNKGLLFGKYSGRFFIPPHLKGDKKNGVVEKDYEVRST